MASKQVAPFLRRRAGAPRCAASSLASRSRLSRSSSACAGREQALEPLVLLDHPELVDGVLDGEQEVALVPGLPDEAEDLRAVDRLLDGGGVGLPGEEHALDAGVALLHEPQELDAVHARHPVVGDHDVHRLAAPGSRARSRPRAPRGRCSGPAQHAPQGAADVLVVVDDEDRGLAGERDRPSGGSFEVVSIASPVGDCTTRSRSRRTRGPRDSRVFTQATHGLAEHPGHTRISRRPVPGWAPTWVVERDRGVRSRRRAIWRLSRRRLGASQERRCVG